MTDELDLTAPYILQTTPGPEATYVPEDRDWSIIFSKRMRVEPMYGIGVTESPTPVERCSGVSGCTPEPLWRVPFVSVGLDNVLNKEVSLVLMSHGPFLEGLRQIYIPYVNSDVEDVHYNCMYPGQGPNTATDNTTDRSIRCEEGVNCCINPNDSNINDFCCNGLESGNSESAAAACASNLSLP